MKNHQQLINGKLTHSVEQNRACAYSFLRSKRPQVSERKFAGQLEFWEQLGYTVPEAVYTGSDLAVWVPTTAHEKRVKKMVRSVRGDMRGVMCGKQQGDWLRCISREQPIAAAAALTPALEKDIARIPSQ